ncbi:MAG: CHAD domain-containing protein, partial [Planctomycetales bacterium]|nr:CHAD domain-containing protein [Planctomycetales bacterium]
EKSDRRTKCKPVARVASGLVRERLVAVQRAWLPAVERWEEDDEFVHRLRVAARRAAAAMDTFAKMLPARRRKKLRRWLKQIRRTAGAARDLDVMNALLREASESPGASQAERETARRFVIAARRKAQQRLAKTHHQLRHRFVPRCIDALVRRVRWREASQEPTFADAAQRLLRPAVAEFIAAAEAPLAGPKDFHALRIAGKRLRYTMELFAPAFDDAFRDGLLCDVRNLQDQLGRLNDHAAAGIRLRAWAQKAAQDEDRRHLLRLANAENAACQSQVAAFLQWWTPEFRLNLSQRLSSFGV